MSQSAINTATITETLQGAGFCLPESGELNGFGETGLLRTALADRENERRTAGGF